MAIFSFAPSYGSDVTRTPRVNKAQAADRYAQRAIDGLNNVPEVWELTFANISWAAAAEILSFLRTHKGTTPFLWTASGRAQRQYVCGKWSQQFDDAGILQVKCTFSQDFSPLGA